jgi:pimeloyl-ACP methyl ester carboxylesterase
MTVVLLHGLGGESSQPLSLFAPVIPPTLTVVAPDIRAHGSSTVVGEASDFALQNLADEVASALIFAGHGATPLTLIGISMGAAIALRLALDPRLEVSDAVFVRPAFIDHGLPQNLRPFPVIAQLLADHGAVEGERRFRQGALFARAAAESPVGADALLQQFRHPLAVERSRRLVEIPRNRAWSDASEPASVTACTAVVAAVGDPVHPITIARQWAEALPRPVYAEVPSRDAGYGAQVAASRQAVTRFLGWSAT